MANKILMPKLSPTMEAGQISSWVKKEGDPIEENETIAEVDTDKATMEMTSLEAGTLLKIVVPAGENAMLGQTIGVIGKSGEDISAILNEIESEGAVKGTATALEPAAERAKDELSAKTSPAKALVQQDSAPETTRSNGRILVSPIAARMATENAIDLRSIPGSGPNGRIIKRDIESIIQRKAGIPAPGFAKPAGVFGASAFREENTSPMRRIIAQRLTSSIGPVPTFYLTVEIEMDQAIEFRRLINESIAPEKVSVNDVIVKAAAMASVKHPFVNSSYRDDRVRFFEDADVGVAVAVDEGLITPVVRAANKKSIPAIALEVQELAGRARAKKLLPEEYTGATFSISNLGMFGIREFTAIINPPEAAIFAIGAAKPTAVVRDGAIIVRNIMSVTMSCDHRVIDGATGARFLQTFRQMLENPGMMFV